MLNYIKNNYSKIAIISIYSLVLGTCSYQVTGVLSNDGYKEAHQYYADKACSELSCEHPDYNCMEYCYKKEVK